jgi:hypothetical protein
MPLDEGDDVGHGGLFAATDVEDGARAAGEAARIVAYTAS